MSPPGLQCYSNEITLKEQTASASPWSWNKAPTAVSHHDPNMGSNPFLGLLCAQQHFRKICEDLRCLLLRSDAPKARGCRGGQRLHLEQVMAKHTGTEPGVSPEALLSITHSPGNSQPGDSSRAKPGSPGVRSRSGWRRQEARCRFSCSVAAVWNQLQHFYWFHPFHHVPFLLRTASSSFPAMPCPCLCASVCQGCKGQWSIKDHSSNQKDFQELFKDLQELQAGLL